MLQGNEDVLLEWLSDCELLANPLETGDRRATLNRPPLSEPQTSPAGANVLLAMAFFCSEFLAKSPWHLSL